jgi:hypothetical protein
VMSSPEFDPRAIAESRATPFNKTAPPPEL